MVASKISMIPEWYQWYQWTVKKNETSNQKKFFNHAVRMLDIQYFLCFCAALYIFSYCTFPCNASYFLYFWLWNYRSCSLSLIFNHWNCWNFSFGPFFLKAYPNDMFCLGRKINYCFQIVAKLIICDLIYYS